MEHYLIPDTKRILLTMGISVGLIFTFFAVILSRTKQAVKPYLKSILIYLLLFGIAFGLTGLAAAWVFKNNYQLLFALLQIVFLCWGIANRYALPKYMKWHDEQSFWLDVLFSILVAVVGSLAFYVVFRTFNRDGMGAYFLWSALLFLMPILLVQTFYKAVAIPPKVFKLWHYPTVMEEDKYPDEKLLKNLLIISFEFRKTDKDGHYTNFRAKAPVDMEIGDLFFYFINDYNERHPESKIACINPKTGQPIGYLFYKKPKWYTVFVKYIDYQKTTFMNGIRENDVIVCYHDYTV